MTHYYVDVGIDTPERLDDLGPAAVPSDLAYLLADALLKFEKQGSPRPQYTVYARDQDGNARDLTKAEQEAFNTALEQALEEVT